MTTDRVPLNAFGIPFGLAGLATSWRIAGDLNLAPAQIANGLVIVATVVWVLVFIAYLRYVLATTGAFNRDVRDMTVGPFASLAVITPLVLAVDGLIPVWPSGATVVIDALIVVVVVAGAWLTGTWMKGGTEFDRLHPGYFLPTVAGALIAAVAGAELGQDLVAQVMFGLGLLSWVTVGSMVLARLIFRPSLPDALLPTMAVMVAPAAVASLALFFASGGHITTPIAVLAGYGLLMVLAQLPLIPRYARLDFSIGTWAFTFSWAAVASTALFWVSAENPVGKSFLSYLILTAITALVGVIALRTLIAIRRRSLLAAPAQPVASRLPDNYDQVVAH